VIVSALERKKKSESVAFSQEDSADIGGGVQQKAGNLSPVGCPEWRAKSLAQVWSLMCT
jgi:hypothetical protein